MIILYLDTSSSFLRCAIAKDQNILESINLKLEKDLSKYALKHIDNLLKKNNLDINKIEKIIVVNGPGSFTGVRIGLTIAKTLAWAKNIEVIPISSLRAMALSSNTDSDFVVPIIDARRGFVYGSIYDTKNDNFILEEKYISLNTLLTAAQSITSTTNDQSTKITIITDDDIETDYIKINYIPNYENIIRKSINGKSINPHLLDANYLKMTEAEERKNDC